MSFEFWSFDIGHYLVIGVWNLVIDSLSIDFSQDDVDAPNGRDDIGDQAALDHLGKGAQIKEGRRSYPHPERMV